jgi:hypothetical protein
MGIVHAAFRRDLTRVRLVLTTTPVPQGSRRQAVAGQVLWLTEMLHAHHEAEDAGLWPFIRQRNPAAAQLLEAMEADHRAIVPAVEAVTAAAQQYRSTESDGPRLELVQALNSLTDVLLPHLDREVREAMPVVAETLTAPDWDAWQHKYVVKPKSLWQLGLEGHWLIDEIDPEGYQLRCIKCRPCRGSYCRTGSPGPTGAAPTPGGARRCRLGTVPLPGDGPARQSGGPAGRRAIASRRPRPAPDPGGCGGAVRRTGSAQCGLEASTSGTVRLARPGASRNQVHELLAGRAGTHGGAWSRSALGLADTPS